MADPRTTLLRKVNSLAPEVVNYKFFKGDDVEVYKSHMLHDYEETVFSKPTGAVLYVNSQWLGEHAGNLLQPDNTPTWRREVDTTPHPMPF